MGIILTTTDCYATNVSDIDPAHLLTAFAFSYVRGSETKNLSYRIGNDTGASITYTLTCDDSYISFQPSDSGTIADDGLSGTLTLTLTLPADVESADHAATLTVSWTGGSATLPVSYSSVGALEDWTSTTHQERQGDYSDVFSNVVDTFAQPYKLHRFTPIALDDNPYDPYGALNLVELNPTTGQIIRPIGSRDMCSRLNPLSDVGYSHDWAMIRASFQGETIDETASFTAFDGSISHNEKASLYVPSWIDLSRMYALFEDESESGLEPAQYKRTVFAVRRLGKTYALENIRLMEFKQDLGYYEADLIEIHLPTMGSPSYYNPFSITYPLQSDKPYAAFPCYDGVSQLLLSIDA